MSITYDLYKRAYNEGQDWACHVRENGKSRLIFFAPTEAEAKGKALAWVNKSFDTPERRARIAQLAQARVEAKKRKAAKEAV